MPHFPCPLILTMALLMPWPVLADGSLTFQGKVRAGTCDVHVDDAAKSVTMPSLRADELTSLNDAPVPSSETPFELRLVNCRGVRNAYLQFSGTTTGPAAAQYANTGDAKGVALHLIDATRRDVLSASGFRVSLPIAGSAVTYAALAYYFRLGVEQVRQGSVSSAATVIVSYD